MKLTTKKDINLPTLVIPKGTTLELTTEAKAIATTYEGRTLRLSYRNAKANFGAPFCAVPSLATLDRWQNECYCRTPTGHKTEPDGYGEDGSPSWLMLLGWI